MATIILKKWSEFPQKSASKENTFKSRKKTTKFCSGVPAVYLKSLTRPDDLGRLNCERNFHCLYFPFVIVRVLIVSRNWKSSDACLRFFSLENPSLCSVPLESHRLLPPQLMNSEEAINNPKGAPFKVAMGGVGVNHWAWRRALFLT